MTSFWLEHAVLPTGAVRSGVLVSTSDSGPTIERVETGFPAPPAGVSVLRGLTLPGLANVHSHAFHRALRARLPDGRGTFWTWRTGMYEIAARLTPATYHDLARAVFAEMALTGITAVGEFHYVHHQPDGTPYAEPNAMSEALVEAAAGAGIRITLLDTCYLRGGAREPLQGAQIRFGDGSAEGWAERADRFAAELHRPHAKVGAAIHSVRAVPAAGLPVVAAWARRHDAPLHIHLSEQPAENEACLAEYGSTPTGLLHQTDVLGRRTTAVHATHLVREDIALLGGSGTGVCLCPTTERDLADGIGPGAALQAAGSPLSLGSDSHAVIDLFEEARAVETGERVVTGQRGHFTPPMLWAAASANGHRAIGWDSGRIEAGARADLVTVDLDSPRTAGCGADLATAVYAATAADVTDVVVDGRFVVRHREHALVKDVPDALRTSIAAVRTP
ncbi:formimidoylglutamate deiminase [Jatrophihabitans sp. YIM 134969]